MREVTAHEERPSSMLCPDPCRRRRRFVSDVRSSDAFTWDRCCGHAWERRLRCIGKIDEFWRERNSSWQLQLDEIEAELKSLQNSVPRERTVNRNEPPEGCARGRAVLAERSRVVRSLPCSWRPGSATGSLLAARAPK
jgi:hypothetical protein